ncbi:hypothetical protein FLK61_38605 [Paenalkalicoccus suaedae]|uniref:Lipoprotein n=1 Tax=Paenalkalicoccus suaedae TaxID=2592382 RepID=A0A859FIH7_9BACI|nr:hypothetical protein [Paenalkalicoccus suaedae]QKS72534.1 hypothetical protein FLK61_38605 [Paenalkalicoccus suaedae]
MRMIHALGVLTLPAILAGCGSAEEEDAYDGPALSFGIVGDEPDIRENQVEFTPVNLENVHGEAPNDFDGILVMEEHLAEAAEPEYVAMYPDMQTPIFFVGTEAGILPFVDLNNPIGYEETVRRARDESIHIAGFVPDYPVDGAEEETLLTLTFGYPIANNELQTDNPEYSYSELFRFISEH